MFLFWGNDGHRKESKACLSGNSNYIERNRNERVCVCYFSFWVWKRRELSPHLTPLFCPLPHAWRRVQERPIERGTLVNRVASYTRMKFKYSSGDCTRFPAGSIRRTPWNMFKKKKKSISRSSEWRESSSSCRTSVHVVNHGATLASRKVTQPIRHWRATRVVKRHDLQLSLPLRYIDFYEVANSHPQKHWEKGFEKNGKNLEKSGTFDLRR